MRKLFLTEAHSEVEPVPSNIVCLKFVIASLANTTINVEIGRLHRIWRPTLTQPKSSLSDHKDADDQGKRPTDKKQWGPKSTEIRLGDGRWEKWITKESSEGYKSFPVPRPWPLTSFRTEKRSLQSGAARTAGVRPGKSRRDQDHCLWRRELPARYGEEPEALDVSSQAVRSDRNKREIGAVVPSIEGTKEIERLQYEDKIMCRGVSVEQSERTFPLCAAQPWAVLTHSLRLRQ